MSLKLDDLPKNKELHTIFNLLLPVIQANPKLCKRSSDSSFKIGNLIFRIHKTFLSIKYGKNKNDKMIVKNITNFSIMNNIVMINDIIGIKYI